MGLLDFLKSKAGEWAASDARKQTATQPALSESAVNEGGSGASGAEKIVAQAAPAIEETAAERQARIENLAILTAEAIMSAGETVLKVWKMNPAMALAGKDAQKVFKDSVLRTGLETQLKAPDFSGLGDLQNFERPDIVVFCEILSADLANQWSMKADSELGDILFGHIYLGGDRGLQKGATASEKRLAQSERHPHLLRNSPASLNHEGSVRAAEAVGQLQMEIKKALAQAIGFLSEKTPAGVAAKANERAQEAWWENIGDQIAGYGPQLDFQNRYGEERAKSQGVIGFKGALRKQELEAALANMSLAEYQIAQSKPACEAVERLLTENGAPLAEKLAAQRKNRALSAELPSPQMTPSEAPVARKTKAL